jgi:hypothetical protein
MPEKKEERGDDSIHPVNRWRSAGSKEQEWERKRILSLPGFLLPGGGEEETPGRCVHPHRPWAMKWVEIYPVGNSGLLRLETERGIISNGVKEEREWRK